MKRDNWEGWKAYPPKRKERQNMRGNYLRAWIIHAGMKNQDLAEALGMSTMALSRRINGRAEWTWREVQAAGRLLNIPMEEWAQVFQTESVA